MHSLAKGFQPLAQGGFEVGTIADAQVRGAQPGDGRPYLLDLSLPLLVGVQRSHLLSHFRMQPAAQARIRGNAGSGFARNYRSPDGRFRTVP